MGSLWELGAFGGDIVFHISAQTLKLQSNVAIKFIFDTLSSKLEVEGLQAGVSILVLKEPHPVRFCARH
jgi:hypothetical protein